MKKALRVYCLYRVSLSRQVDHVQQNGERIADIPMQRTACRQFCAERGWMIAAEFQEPGVSGFKSSTFQREAIQEIVSAARKQAFEVLLVYTIDRLSRRDSDLPLLFSEITECGIAVWSVEEGELRYQTATDRLLVYLQGWKANGESERIGQRISTIQSQMVARGEYRGGPVPFGYKLIENGKTSKQGRKQHSLAINAEEAVIVRMIFEKLVYEKYSMYELTKLLTSLDALPNVRAMTWRSTTLHVLVRNPIYIGCLRYNDTVSLPYAHLQIIDPEVFQLAQKRFTKKKERKRQEELTPPPAYHDILYCGHCGSHLVYNHAVRVRNDGSTYVRYLYRCYNKERFSNRCDGACTYSARIIDEDVRRHVELLTTILLSSDESALIGTAVERARAEYLNQRDSLKAQLNDLDNQLEVLRQNIIESLRLYGISSTSLLQQLYGDLKMRRQVIQLTMEQLDPAQYELPVLTNQKKRELVYVREKCKLWKGREKSKYEILISQFFHRILAHQDYDIRYEIMPEVRQFLAMESFSDPYQSMNKYCLK